MTGETPAQDPAERHRPTDASATETTGTEPVEDLAGDGATASGEPDAPRRRRREGFEPV